MGCMGLREDSGGPCKSCGFDETAYQAPPHHLPVRTILNGKYLIGRALGEGGFGITYLGWDLNLEMKLAIKEYYPSGFVTRDRSTSATVTPFTGEKGDFFAHGRDKFMVEAKLLAKFYALPGVVSVRDFFLENGTAYIVMEFIDGVTLKEYLRRMGGRLPAGTVFSLLKPVVEALGQVHKAGLIHRDISPDNIMLTKDGTVKLLDFGAAREISPDGEKSNTVNIKTGYAPEEQYRTHGSQGPWTDVYALCATIYKCLTGITPEESLERLRNDTVVPPSRLGIAIPPIQEAALMRGMAVMGQERFRSVEALHRALYGGAPGAPVSPAGGGAATQTVMPTMPVAHTAAGQPGYQPAAGRGAGPPNNAPVFRGGKEEAVSHGTAKPGAKLNRKTIILIIAAVAAVVLLIVIVTAGQSCAKGGADTGLSGASSVSSQASSSEDVTAQGGFTKGAYEDENITFQFSEEWLPAIDEKTGLPWLSGHFDGVAYEFRVLGVSKNMSEDVADFIKRVLPVTPAPGGMGALSNSTLGDYSATTTGCLYLDGDVTRRMDMAVLTDGKTRVAIGVLFPRLNEEQVDEKTDSSVIEPMIDSFKIKGSKGGGTSSNSAAKKSLAIWAEANLEEEAKALVDDFKADNENIETTLTTMAGDSIPTMLIADKPPGILVLSYIEPALQERFDELGYRIDSSKDITGDLTIYTVRIKDADSIGADADAVDAFSTYTGSLHADKWREFFGDDSSSSETPDKDALAQNVKDRISDSKARRMEPETRITPENGADYIVTGFDIDTDDNITYLLVDIEVMRALDGIGTKIKVLPSEYMVLGVKKDGDETELLVPEIHYKKDGKDKIATAINLSTGDPVKVTLRYTVPKNCVKYWFIQTNFKSESDTPAGPVYFMALEPKG